MLASHLVHQALRSHVLPDFVHFTQFAEHDLKGKIGVSSVVPGIERDVDDELVLGSIEGLEERSKLAVSPAKVEPHLEAQQVLPSCQVEDKLVVRVLEDGKASLGVSAAVLKLLQILPAHRLASHVQGYLAVLGLAHEEVEAVDEVVGQTAELRRISLQIPLWLVREECLQLFGDLLGYRRLLCRNVQV